MIVNESEIGICKQNSIHVHLLTNTYLLLAECEVHTASYGLSFFCSFYGPSAKHAGHKNKEGKNEDP